MVEIANTGITLRQLQILREVVRTDSERAAAKALDISQPAVSQQVKQLERLLGVQLFMRDKARLVPTAPTMALFRDTDAIFTEIDRIAKTIASLKDIERDSISIAAPYVFSFRLLPDVIRELRARQPVSAIHLKSGSYHEVADHVLNGRADIGLARLPLDEKVFDWCPAATATNVYIFHPSHRFSQMELIRPEDLIGEPFADLEPQMHSHQMNENALRYMGAEPHLAIEVDIIGQEINFVAAGLGIASSNTFAARQISAFQVEVRPSEPSALYHYVVFWQKGRRLGPVLQEAVNVLVEFAEGEPGLPSNKCESCRPR
ncbi:MULTISPECIES: LysR family transcriptional regulator [unclassified Rhizobium]|uniref:LysR family transcriptional regulator n=1 Tax=unclassified Rhizobium TaxID=2613769 RepID=UPI001AD969AB|nr:MULTISPECIES: LysR family transcriptional regulator [unclassified Rhizobium]MBO9101917.1 LysR family transcriptional regulator [Rhizobium sp. L58/93]MBO9172088.1 LysR family transcriptional regulator [Rhizobium sp. L245/93]QXZ88306.1 LysR family transcriptional regulator [Rhizobium sp. K1/93]QXZ94277.1 LysR family transcriptional regulator [Rhizobium sp. K15/93]QYA05634.1 LysR family transcriptional regulator [Rhizobium sp. B21/90]